MESGRTIQTVRCDPPASRICTVPGVPGLLLEAEERLWLAGENLLLERARKREKLKLAEAEDGEPLMEEAGAEWSVNPATRTVACVDEELILTRLDATPVQRRISLPALSDPPVAAFGDDKEEIFLVKTLCDEDAVVDRSDFHCLNARDGSVTWPKALSVYGVSQVRWSTAAGAFFVHAMALGKLWRIEPRSAVLQEIDFHTENHSLELCDVALDAEGETVALHFQDEDNRDHWVQFGGVDRGGICWEPLRPMRAQMAPPLWLHPRGHVFACEIEQGLQPLLNVYDRECTLLLQVVLPFGWLTQGMAWSGRSNDLYLLGADTIGIFSSD